MKNKRREFLKLAGLTGLGVAGADMLGFAAEHATGGTIPAAALEEVPDLKTATPPAPGSSVIGLYGEWASGLRSNKLPGLSFRKAEWNNVETWRKGARQRVVDRMSIPAIGSTPAVSVKREHSYEGLHIEELSWQLPYGRPTEAILLKPAGAKGRLPAILAFHDHGGNKYFGCSKITKTGEEQNLLMKEHQELYYENFAWANEIAKRGYVVLVADAFAFASRRVMLQDVPTDLRNGLSDPEATDAKGIQAYNDWAGQHEHILAKSLFCAGTTWPGVFFAEDQKALDILCSREDVDADRIGCGGLSGGGLRTVFMAGVDPRIKCAVDVGFMTTWKDFLLNKSFTHTWMAYVPLLPNELDFPEILGLRAPLPTLVLNDSDDQLYTLPEMKNAQQILEAIFTKANAADHFKCSFYPGPHKFDAKMQAEAFDWFDRWLKKA